MLSSTHKHTNARAQTHAQRCAVAPAFPLANATAQGMWKMGVVCVVGSEQPVPDATVKQTAARSLTNVVSAVALEFLRASAIAMEIVSTNVVFVAATVRAARFR